MLVPLVRDFTARPWSEQLVDPVVLELCRLRIAAIVGCPSELGLRYRPAIDAGLSEEKIDALSQWASSDLFSAAEQACIGLAEQYTIDAHGVDDAQMARVADHLSPPEVVALVCALATFDGMARLRAILGVADESPDQTVIDAPTPDRGPLY
jgi:alkylhydroperoxidase family enzyme